MLKNTSYSIEGPFYIVLEVGTTKPPEGLYINLCFNIF